MAVFLAPSPRLLAGLLLTGLLAGCATQKATPEDNTPGVRAAIQDALVRADEKKAQMQAATVPASLQANALTVIWEGDAGEILKRIATSQKLQYKETGPSPRLPMPVFIKLRNATLTQALAAIGEQCGGRADVVLTDSTIELHSKLY